MADVDDTLPEWSSTTASNKPTGATTIGTGLDDNIREVQGVVTRWLSHKGADIASAATTDLGAVEGLLHDITGTATITGFGTIRSGIWKCVKFEGAAILTHNATSLILPGAANIVTADGDVGIFMSEGSGNWRCLAYLAASYVPKRPVLGTEQATTSGTSIDFTGIPSWVKKITIMFDGVSTSGTSKPIVQIGDSGGIEDSGYTGHGSAVTNAAATSVTAFTTGMGIESAIATHTLVGKVELVLMDSSNNTWVMTANLTTTSTTVSTYLSVAIKSLTGTLDRVRITTAGGSETFDAGAINILYE
jgi:hypothetical protein